MTDAWKICDTAHLAPDVIRVGTDTDGTPIGTCWGRDLPDGWQWRRYGWADDPRTWDKKVPPDLNEWVQCRPPADRWTIDEYETSRLNGPEGRRVRCYKHSGTSDDPELAQRVADALNAVESSAARLEPNATQLYNAVKELRSRTEHRVLSIPEIKAVLDARADFFGEPRPSFGEAGSPSTPTVGGEPADPECSTCNDRGIVPATGRGSDGFDPCPDCSPADPESHVFIGQGSSNVCICGEYRDHPIHPVGLRHSSTCGRGPNHPGTCHPVPDVPPSPRSTIDGEPAETERGLRPVSTESSRPETSSRAPGSPSEPSEASPHSNSGDTSLPHVPPSPRPGPGEHLRAALEKIDQHGCQHYTTGHRCWTEGRDPDADYSADAWCNACIARHALDQETTPGEPMRSDARRK